MHSPTISLALLLSSMSVFQGTLCHPASFAAESTSTGVLGEVVQGQGQPTADKVKAVTLRSSGPASKKDTVRELAARGIELPHHGWVGVFSNPNCTGDPIGPRPKMHDNGHCHKLSPPDPKKAKSWLGISWGSDHLDFDQLYLYQWQDCSIGRTQIDRYPGQESFCEEFPIGTVAVVNANGVY